jgi:hypothetical protein
MGGNLAWVGEPFVEYGDDVPEERLDIIRRVAPVTSDTGIAVDMFERNPARLWNMPVNRKFGSWNVAALFNFDFDNRGEAVTQEITMTDLGLDPEKEYLDYEFWRKQFLGTVRKSFTRTVSWKSPENRDVSWVLQFAKGLVGKDCLEASPAARSSRRCANADSMTRRW